MPTYTTIEPKRKLNADQLDALLHKIRKKGFPNRYVMRRIDNVRAEGPVRVGYWKFYEDDYYAFAVGLLEDGRIEFTDSNDHNRQENINMIRHQVRQALTPTARKSDGSNRRTAWDHIMSVAESD